MPATNVLELVGISVVEGNISLTVLDDDGKSCVVPLEGRGLDLIIGAVTKKCLKFTQNEQNAMAIFCQLMSSVAYKFRTENEMPDHDVEDALLDIIDGCGSAINWGDMYDRFHRCGANR